MVCNFALYNGRLMAIAAAMFFWTEHGGAQTLAATDGLNSSAEYITGFVRHVRWRHEERLSTWQVCVIGDLPREQALGYGGRTVRGKPFSVSHVDADAALDVCQVLDLTAAGSELAQSVLLRIRGMPILAVGSGAAFCSAGGQICLNPGADGVQPKRKFEVNLSTIRESTLEVSARLLTVGTVRAADDEPR